MEVFAVYYLIRSHRANKWYQGWLSVSPAEPDKALLTGCSFLNG